MNEHEKPLHAEEQELLDRLVDGDLDDEKHRELLLHLENHPDGWRRCALAFLEAQQWEQELKSLRSGGSLESGSPPSGDLPTPAAPRTPPASRARWIRGPIGSALGMAASFLLAFGLGLAWRSWDGVDQPERGQVAQSRPLVPNSSGQSSAELRSHTPGTHTPGTQWTTVSLPVQRATGEVEELEVPVAVGGNVSADSIFNQPFVLPEQLLNQLERQGHRVRQNRQLVPFQLDDGRQVVFPVDQIDVRFVGERVIP
jgi:hypothetical protein